jgi:hypothetical protein
MTDAALAVVAELADAEPDPSTAVILSAPEPEPIPDLIVTGDALDRFAKFNPAARDLMREFEASKFIWDKIRALVEDEQTRQDTFDGETKLDTLIRNLVSEIIDWQAVAPGCDQKIAELRARKDKAAAAIEVRKELIQAAMIIANWVGKDEKGKSKSLRLDLATITTRPATPSVDYVDESKIPARFYKRPDPVLDKTTLKTLVLGRYRAMLAALELADDNERNAAITKVIEEYGADEIPGVTVKVDGHTTTIKFT